MLLRLTYLTAAHLFAALRLPRTSDHAKAAEILALRHQLAVLEHQLGSSKVKFSPADRVPSPRSWPRCPVRCCAGCGCSSVRTPSCDGIATCSGGPTREPPES
ncbi:hypothetical protein [Streptomyces sp. NPDC017964]|uniref:hypothetical protein n=1 Tax=Streptomyces sp. NPDC017964 TaxID=3365022 RepID=UPI0037B0CFA7